MFSLSWRSARLVRNRWFWFEVHLLFKKPRYFRAWCLGERWRESECRQDLWRSVWRKCGASWFWGATSGWSGVVILGWQTRERERPAVVSASSSICYPPYLRCLAAWKLWWCGGGGAPAKSQTSSSIDHTPFCWKRATSWGRLAALPTRKIALGSFFPSALASSQLLACT